MVSRQKTPGAAILEPTVVAIERGELRSLTMKSVAERAGLSRQGLYLHYPNRSELILALIRYTDERHDIDEFIAPIKAATRGGELLEALARLHVVFHGRIHKVVTFFHAQRWNDEILERAWQRQLRVRRKLCRDLARTLARWGELAEPWTPASAGDWLASMTTVRTYEDLVLSLGWSERRLVEHTALVYRRVLL